MRGKSAFFASVAMALLACVTFSSPYGFAQEEKKEEALIEFSLDVAAATIPRPKIFIPSVDLSGRGEERNQNLPQAIAAPEALNKWAGDIGFSGLYRLQLNLWEASQLRGKKEAEEEFIATYNGILSKVSAAGGTVIVNIFGTPSGMGKVLDKRSPLVNPQEFKELLKVYLKEFSKYNVSYEVWSAPDLDDFFLGSAADYLYIYRCVAEAVKEVEAQEKTHISLGGPGASWWYQNPEGNTITFPERSLIYELIRFCSHNSLPLDFVSWHAYSTDPLADQASTAYNKPPVELIREWLNYFGLKKETPLFVDEWNYDNGLNTPLERSEKANIAASYIPARLKNMYNSGIDGQIYYCLEDFHSNKEQVTRNVGAFWFDAKPAQYKGGPKAAYNVFRMLKALGNDFYAVPAAAANGCVGMLAGKDGQNIGVLVYNYVNTEASRDLLSRDIGSLNPAEKKFLVKIIKSGMYSRIISRQADVKSLHGAGKRLTNLLSEAAAANEDAEKRKSALQAVKISLKNIKGDYKIKKYFIDQACAKDCDFYPLQEKEASVDNLWEETVELPAYSLALFIIEPKPVAAPAPLPEAVTPGLPAETQKPPSLADEKIPPQEKKVDAPAEKSKDSSVIK